VRITNNLASEPFARKRPIWVLTVLMSVVLLGVLAMLVYLNVANRWEARETRERIASLQAETDKVQRDRGSYEAVLRDPQYAEALEQTVFINSLIFRKGVSWTRLFDDLGRCCPTTCASCACVRR
jgi:Tfp pilus assembly protein PilN